MAQQRFIFHDQQFHQRAPVMQKPSASPAWETCVSAAQG
jgi:hypothetical protein